MKKIIGIIICMLLIVSAIPIIGQVTKSIISKDTDEINPSSNGDKWMKTFGGIEDDSGYSVLLTSDGGYIILGATKSYGAGSMDIWLIKTDNRGNMIWDKKYGGKYADYGWCIKQTSDGGYVITGETYSYGNGKSDTWLIKIDSEGNLLWDKTFGYDIFDAGSEVKQTSDGGYIIVGSVNVTGGPRGDIWLIKTDSNGNKLWDKTFGGIGHNYGNCILLTLDGGYLVTGTSFISQETGGYNVWLIKTDDTGEILWDKKYGGTKFDMCSFIQHTDDGGYIITAETESYGTGSSDVWLLKIDSNGEVLWDKTFGGDDIDRGILVQQTSDSGFIIAGHTTGYKSWDAWLIKTDRNGNKEWIKTYGKLFGCDEDIFFSVQQTPDGGYIVGGATQSYGVGGYDVWLIKTDANGNVARNRQYIYRPFLNFLQSHLNLFPMLKLLFQRYGLQ